MLDVLIAVVLLAFGFAMGRGSAPKKTEPPTVEEQELLRLQEDKQAFARLMEYNAERAYGTGAWDA